MYQFVSGALQSESTYTALTNLNLHLLLKHPATVSTGNIFRIPCVSSDDEDFIVRYGTNKIEIQTTADRHEDPAIFSIPVTANAWDSISISLNPNTLNLPVAYKNGVAQTVTTIDSGTVAGVMATDYWYIGEGTTNLGLIGAVAIWNAQFGTGGAHQLLTQAKKYYMPLFVRNATLVEFVPMDDFPVGEYTAVGADIKPNADVQNTWSAGTYTNLLTSDDSRLIANKSDDNETYICDLETTTPSSGFSVYSLTTYLEGNTDDTAQPTSKLTLGSGGGDLSSWSLGFSSSDSVKTKTDYGAYTQAQIDGLRLNLTVPTMGKDDEIAFDVAKVTVGSRRHASLTKSGNNWRSSPSSVLSVGLNAPGWTL